MRLLLSLFLALLLNACATPQLRGTGDLGLIIERSSGHVTLVNTTSRQPYARISGLGDLSHASAVYSRDGRYAFIFGRDGGLTKIDLLEAKIVKHHPVRQCHRRLDLAGWPHRRRPELHAGRHQGLRRRYAGTAFRSAG
jgi:hypothetical protein